MDFKKILVAGCSWSEGYGIDNYSGYGEELEKIFSCKVVNVASSGTSVGYAVHKIYSYLTHSTPDLIILQLSTLDRAVVPIDGFDNFLKGDIKVITEEGLFYRLNHGSYLEVDKFIEDLYKHSKTEPIKGFKEFLKFYFERVSTSNINLAQIFESVAGLIAFAKSKNIKILTFPYLKYGWRHLHNTEKKERSAKDIYTFDLIDKSSYIDLSFEEFVGEIDELKKLSIDNGFHLSKKGHKILAEKFLLPYIKKL